jgi:hypothetical protein
VSTVGISCYFCWVEGEGGGVDAVDCVKGGRSASSIHHPQQARPKIPSSLNICKNGHCQSTSSL